jgi:DNA polymerase-1
MEKIFVLDASGYLYRSYFAIRNITNARGESTNALFGFIRSVLKLFKDFHPDHFVAVFDGPRNAKPREEIYAHYKAHRAEAPSDLFYQMDWARQFCELMGIPILNIPEVEADDTMGAVAKWAEHKGATVYLCTSDKDLAQMVSEKVFLLNTHKENLILGPKEVEETYGVPPQQIIDLLAMTGDSSDNIPGLTGFGPKTAAALLKQFGSLDYLLQHPQEVGGKKQETLIHEADNALISRRLVTLHTNVEIPNDESFFKLQRPNVPILKEFYASMNFNTLIKELEQMEPQQSPQLEASVEYILVDEEKELTDLISYLAKQKEICFETETTDILPIKAELVGIGFCVEPKKAWYIPVNGRLGLQKVLEVLKPLFENPKISFYGHNVKYSYQVLANYGIKIHHVGFDTILASYLLNSQSRQHSLDHLSLEYFGKVKTPISSLIGKGKKIISMREVPIQQVCTYCCEDVDYTCRLKELLEKELHKRKLTHLLKEIELPLAKVLAGMERRGIYLDTPCLEKSSKEILHHIKSLEQEIYQLAGQEFNLNSPKQMSEILFTKLGIRPPKKTATGHSTNADVLEGLQGDYPIAGKLLEYRTLEKLRSTYLEILPQQINPKTQRIHCTFNQWVAATGRLSCQDPNLQNIPVRTEVGRQIREAFRPEKTGWSYLAADYSQIELRLLAHLSEDPSLLAAFKNNEDVHAYTAAIMYGVPIQMVTKEMRHSAKAVNFGVIYGQQAFGLSQELGISVKEAAAFIDTYFKRYSKVKDYVEYTKEQARKTGKAVTYTGRERAIPEINSPNGQLRIAAERLAINTPLQGTAADLIKIAMLKIDKALEKEKTLGYMILQIHDELIFELPDFEIMTIEPIVRRIMEGVLELKVPLVVDITVGKNWKEC